MTKTKKPAKKTEAVISKIERTPTPSKLGKRERLPRKIFSPSAYDERRPIKEEPISPDASRASSLSRASQNNTTDQKAAGPSTSKETPSTTKTTPRRATQKLPSKPSEEDSEEIQVVAGKKKSARLSKGEEKNSPAIILPHVQEEEPQKNPEKEITKEIETLVREPSPEVFTPSLAERVKRHSAAKANANMLKAMETPQTKGNVKKSSSSKMKKTPVKKPQPTISPKGGKPQITPKVPAKTAAAKVADHKSPAQPVETKKPPVKKNDAKEKQKVDENTKEQNLTAEPIIAAPKDSGQPSLPETSREGSAPNPKTTLARVLPKNQEPAVNSSKTKTGKEETKTTLKIEKSEIEPQNYVQEQQTPVTRNGHKSGAVLSTKGESKQTKTGTATPIVIKTILPSTPSSSIHTAEASEKKSEADQSVKQASKNGSKMKKNTPAEKNNENNHMNEMKKEKGLQQTAVEPTLEADPDEHSPSKAVNGSLQEIQPAASSSVKITLLPKKTEAFMNAESRIMDLSSLSQNEDKSADVASTAVSKPDAARASSPPGATFNPALFRDIKQEPLDEDDDGLCSPIRGLFQYCEPEERLPSLKFTISLKGTPSIHATSKRRRNVLPKLIVPEEKKEERVNQTETSVETIGLEEEYNEEEEDHMTLRRRGKNGRFENKKAQPKLLPTFSTTPSKPRISSPLKKETPPDKSCPPEPLLLLKKDGSDDSSQCSASPELGGSGLGFTYAKPKFDYDFEKKEELEEELPETPYARRLRPRKKTLDHAESSDSLDSAKNNTTRRSVEESTSSAPNVSRPKHRRPPPQAWFKGVVEDFPEHLELSELSFSLEKKKYEEAARLAIRTALLAKHGKQKRISDPPKPLVGRWVRPTVDEGQPFDPKDFLPVQAEVPQLLPKQLAELEEDRDVQVWPTPPDDFGLYEERVEKYLRKAGTNKVGIDQAMRFLHASCGHNVKQARKTLLKRKNLDLLKMRDPPPMTEDDEETFCLMYMGFGKNFAKYVKRFPDYTVADIVKHYYDTKKRFKYKKMVQTASVEEKFLEPFRRDRDVKNFYSGLCHLCKKSDKYLVNKDEWYICRTCRFFQNEVISLPRKSKDECAIYPQYYQYMDDHTDLRLKNFYGVEDFEQDFMVQGLKKPTRTEVEKMVKEEQERLKKMGISSKKVKTKHSKLGEDFYKQLSPFYRENVVPSKEEEMEALEDKICPMKRDGRRINLRDLMRNLHKEQIKPFAIPKKLRIPKEKTTEEFTEKDYYFTMQALIRYGLNFELVAEIVGTKTPTAVENFYNQNKVNIDKVLEKCSPDSEKETATYIKMLVGKNPHLKETIYEKYNM